MREAIGGNMLTYVDIPARIEFGSSVGHEPGSVMVVAPTTRFFSTVAVHIACLDFISFLENEKDPDHPDRYWKQRLSTLTSTPTDTPTGHR